MKSQDAVSMVVINLSDVAHGELVDKRKIMVGYQEVKELFDLRGDDSEPVMVMVNVGTNMREQPHFTSSVGIATANSLAAGKNDDGLHLF